jgi:hypothetical protein
MIDIIAAIDSVVVSATELDARRREGRGGAEQSVTEGALALAIPAARQPNTAAAMLERLRADAAATARAVDCTLGAVLVWRAVDRAERAGQGALDAAETGLLTALAYLELVSAGQFDALGLDEPGRCAALAILEVQARLALSHAVEETA